MFIYNVLTVIVFVTLLQFIGCSGDHKIKNEDVKVAKQESEIEKVCKTKVIYYNTKCCSDSELQSDFEYVIKQIKINDILSREGVAVLPYEGESFFELVCDSSKLKIESVLTDIDLLMAAYAFFGIRLQ